MTELTGPRFEPEGEAPLKGLVIMLHGVGADGNDLIGIAPHLSPALPGVAFVAPDGPDPCDMAPFGRQWFSLQNRDPEVMAKVVAEAGPVVDAFIDAEMARTGLPAGKIVLMGFSQGTMMSMYVAPRRAEPLAGVLGYSGALVNGSSLRTDTVSTPPFLLIHGEDDDVVPFEAMAAAKAALETVGIPCESIARPGLGHGIDNEGLVNGLAFMKQALEV